MNSNVCHRCRIKPSELTCKECQSSLCSQCDKFVHSSLKKGHKRKKTKNFSISEENTNYETNFNFFNNTNNSPSNIKNIENMEEKKDIYYNINDLNKNTDSQIKYDYNFRNKLNSISRISHDKLLNTYNSGFNVNYDENPNINRTYNLDYTNRKKYFDNNKDNNDKIKDIKLNVLSNRNSKKNNYLNHNPIQNTSSKYISQIKEIYEQEKRNYIIKINNLTQELENTKANLSERINFLHKHLYEIENKHETNIREQNDKNLLEMKKVEEEKSIEIKNLQNIISDQNNIINELKTKIKDLESTITDKESLFLKSKTKIDNISKEKESIENFYKNEIEQIKKKHNEEKENLISEYEHVINQISAELDINKKIYLNALKEIKEKENMIQNVMDDANNEKEQLNNNIIKLKEQNNFEQNNLLEINSDLKFESENKSEKIEQLKNEIKNLTEENEMMKSKFKKMNNNNNFDIDYYNSKINEIIRDTLSKKSK